MDPNNFDFRDLAPGLRLLTTASIAQTYLKHSEGCINYKHSTMCNCGATQALQCLGEAIECFKSVYLTQGESDESKEVPTASGDAAE